MNKKLVAFFCLVISLVLLATCAFAEDWNCPDCGKDNSGNFCYNCGLKKPEKSTEKKTEKKADESEIKNIQCKVQDNGDVVVSWDDSSNSFPYSVSYQGQYDVGLMDPVKSKKDILQYLIPTEKYTITVSNGKSTASREFTVPLKVFTEFSSSAKKIVVNETRFSISEVEKQKTKQFQFQVHYPQLRKSRSYKGKLVTKTPFGYGGYVYVWTTFELGSQYSYIYEDFSMHQFFEGIKNDFDEIPKGQYVFEMYFDGQLYDSFAFNVVP